MKRSSRTILISAVAAMSALSSPIHSGSFPAMDLERAVAYALEHNAAFRAELAKRDEVAGGVTEVGADAWPQVELVSSWSRSRNPSLLNSADFEDIVGQFPDFAPGEQELWSLALEVEQPIYSGGKVRAAIELAELVVDITDSQIQTARLELALRTAETYFNLLRAHDALDSLETQRLARTEALKVVQDRYDLGEATELERLRADAALAQVAPAVAQAEGDAKAYESRLRALLGLPVNTEIELLPPSQTAESPELPALEKLLQLATHHRPELRDLKLQTDALDRRRIVAHADSRPQVDLTGAYGRQVRLLEDLEDDLFADWRISLGMTWKLFDGGRRKGKIAQLESLKDQLGWQREELLRAIAHDIERSLADFTTAVERRRAAGIAARATQEASRVAGESYRLGVALQADLLDAQDQAIRQELAANDAFFDTLIEFSRLRRALGLLPTAELTLSSRSSSNELTSAQAPALAVKESTP